MPRSVIRSLLAVTLLGAVPQHVLARQAPREAEGPLSQALEALAAPNAESRRHAAEAIRRLELGARRASALAALTAGLGDEDDRVREAVATTLGVILASGRPPVSQPSGDEALARALLEAVADPSRRVREAALQALAMGARPRLPSVEPVLQALQDESPRVRQLAALCLGVTDAGSSRVIAALRQLARRDVDPAVRAAATTAVAATCGQPCGEMLVEALGDSDMLVRQSALRELASRDLVRGEAIPTITALLEDREQLEVVRLLSASALGRARPVTRAMVRSLIAVLENRAEGTDLRAYAAGALGQAGHGSEGALSALKDGLADPEAKVRAACAGGLSQLAKQEAAALSAVTEAARAGNPIAIRALARLGTGQEPWLIQVLLESLDVKDAERRLAGIRAIERLDHVDTRLVDRLRHMAMSEPDPELRALAERVSRQLQPPESNRQ